MSCLFCDLLELQLLSLPAICGVLSPSNIRVMLLPTFLLFLSKLSGGYNKKHKAAEMMRNAVHKMSNVHQVPKVQHATSNLMLHSSHIPCPLVGYYYEATMDKPGKS